jgi:hypothetical protein
VRAFCSLPRRNRSPSSARSYSATAPWICSRSWSPGSSEMARPRNATAQRVQAGPVEARAAVALVAEHVPVAQLVTLRLGPGAQGAELAVDGLLALLALGRDPGVGGSAHGAPPSEGLTGVGILHWSGLPTVDGDREPGRGLRPGLGGEPEATPQPAMREQVAQPLDAQPDQADPPWAGAQPRRGRGAQAGGRQAALVRVLDPGAVRQRRQAGHRQHQPVPRDPGRGRSPARDATSRGVVVTPRP